MLRIEGIMAFINFVFEVQLLRLRLRYVNAVLRIQVSRDGVRCSFAAIRADGSVVTWGDPSAGGCCRMVQQQLFDVQEIQGTEDCFAAIRSDGGPVVHAGNMLGTHVEI